MRRVRQKETRDSEELAYGDIRLDPTTHRVFVDAKELELTKLEFGFLRMLIAAAGSVVSRADLARTIWGLSARDASRSIDVCVSGLRRKFGGTEALPRYI